MNEFEETDVGDQTINVAAADRKFQTSVIVKQDPNKSGILSFLRKVEQQTQGQPQTGTSTSQSNSGGYS